MGILSSASKLSAVENSVTVSALARRRLPVVMTRLRMAEHLRAAVTMIEQGHVRVGTEVVTDPAFLVTRSLEVCSGWSYGGKGVRVMSCRLPALFIPETPSLYSVCAIDTNHIMS